MSRLAVPKTYKLYIGGAFPRSESGRTYEVAQRRRATFLANAAQASRKDARDAVVAARAARSTAGRARPRTTAARCSTASPSCSRAVARSSSTRSSQPRASRPPRRPPQVDEAIDRWVWYAGWADKFAQVAGNGNPVAGPYFNISVPEPTGVVAIVAPQDTVAARPRVGGRPGARRRATRSSWSRQRAATRCRRSASPRCSRRATCPGASSTCSPARPPRSRRGSPSHADVNALDLVGAGDLDWVDLQIAAADTLKRVLPPEPGRMPRRRASTASRRSPRRRPSGTRRA